MSSAMTEFPYSLIIDTPFPTNRLATIAKKAIEVDSELSSLVQRDLSVVSSTTSKSTPSTTNGNNEVESEVEAQQNNILRTEYRATTNRMLRVAVNGYMESLGVVLEVMQELDVDVLESQQTQIQTGSKVGGGGGGVNGETT